jgi:hypothetical protein
MEKTLCEQFNSGSDIQTQPYVCCAMTIACRRHWSHRWLAAMRSADEAIKRQTFEISGKQETTWLTCYKLENKIALVFNPSYVFLRVYIYRLRQAL